MKKEKKMKTAYKQTHCETRLSHFKFQIKYDNSNFGHREFFVFFNQKKLLNFMKSKKNGSK